MKDKQTNKKIGRLSQIGGNNRDMAIKGNAESMDSRKEKGNWWDD